MIFSGSEKLMGAKVLISVVAVTSAVAGSAAGWTLQGVPGQSVIGPKTWIPLGVVVTAIGLAVGATWRVFGYMSNQEEMTDTVERLHRDVETLMTLLLGSRDPKTNQRVSGLVQRFDNMNAKIDRLLEKQDQRRDEFS